MLAEAYDAVADRPGRGRPPPTTPTGPASGLEAALAAGRADDLRRGVSTVGPHRDDVDLRHRRPAGPHPRVARASSARWRWRCAWPSTAWSPRSPAAAPVLLLDDVFSELDPDRSDALLANLPAGQTAAHQRQRPAARRPEPDRVLRGRATAASRRRR